jgi:hypothetical protein
MPMRTAETNLTEGMPGGNVGSSNGADPNSAILACTVPWATRNSRITRGRLLVYDPIRLTPDVASLVVGFAEGWGGV